MELKISKLLQEIIEQHDIDIVSTWEQGSETLTDLEFYSDEGEDVVITVWHKNTDETFVDFLKKWYAEFDPEEHAVMWYNAKNKVPDVPLSLRDLLNDADGIKEKIGQVIGNITYRKAMESELV